MRKAHQVAEEFMKQDRAGSGTVYCPACGEDVAPEDYLACAKVKVVPPFAGQVLDVVIRDEVVRKAEFWDAFMDLWRTPNDMTPMEDVRAMVTGVSKLVARYDARASAPALGHPKAPALRRCGCTGGSDLECHQFGPQGDPCNCACHPENR